MTNRLAIAMQKGGVGKSTTSLTLAGALARDDDVLLVDADPQGFSTITMGEKDAYVGESSLYEVMTDIDRFGYVNDLIVERDTFDILPSHGRNFKLEKELWSESRTKERLGMVLDEIEHDYDWIIIDSPPNMGPLADGALLAAKNVLFVSKPDSIATFSMNLLMNEKKKLEREFKTDIGILGAVVNFAKRNKISESRLEWFDEYIGEENTFVVPETVAIEGAFQQQSTVYDFTAKNSHREQKAAEVRAIFDDLAAHAEEYYA